MEENPSEAVKNNIFGTLNTVRGDIYFRYYEKKFIAKLSFEIFYTLMFRINKLNIILKGSDRGKIISKQEEMVPAYKRF